MKTILKILCLLLLAAAAHAGIQVINLGTSPTGSGGDSAPTAFTKANDNFSYLNSALANLNFALTNYMGTNVPGGGTVTNNTVLSNGGNVGIAINGTNDFTLSVTNADPASLFLSSGGNLPSNITNTAPVAASLVTGAPWQLLATNSPADGQLATAAGTGGDWVWADGPRQEWAYAPASSPWTPTFDGKVNHVYTLTNNCTINISGTNGNVSILCYSNITVAFSGTTISWGTSNSPPTICTNAVIGLTAYGPKVVGGYKELQ